MNTFLDTLWQYIVIIFQYAGDTLFTLLQHFHFLGPAVIISILALTTVAVTKLLNRVVITRRYLELEKEFQYWYDIRQEALKNNDAEKGKHLARNIDQAQLNQAYYNYFFEGFMLGLVRRVLPIFFMFGFINEYYRTAALQQLFNKGYVLAMPTTSGDPLLIGGVFWYFLSLIGGYIVWALVKRYVRRPQANVSGYSPADCTQ